MESKDDVKDLDSSAGQNEQVFEFGGPWGALLCSYDAVSSPRTLIGGILPNTAVDARAGWILGTISPETRNEPQSR